MIDGEEEVWIHKLQTGTIKYSISGSVGTETVFGKPKVNHDSNMPKTRSVETVFLNFKDVSVRLFKMKWLGFIFRL